MSIKTRLSRLRYPPIWQTSKIHSTVKGPRNKTVKLRFEYPNVCGKSHSRLHAQQQQQRQQKQKQTPSEQ